jgi:hypothetical protein
MQAPPPLWLQKHTYLRAHEFVHCPELWHQPRLAKVTCSWSRVPCGIKPVIHLFESHGSEKLTCRLWFTIQLQMVCRVMVGWLVYGELEFIYKEAVVSLLRYHFCIFLDRGKPLKFLSGLLVSGPRCAYRTFRMRDVRFSLYDCIWMSLHCRVKFEIHWHNISYENTLAVRVGRYSVQQVWECTECPTRPRTVDFFHCICIVWLGITSRNLATLHGITHVGDRSAQTPKAWFLRYYLRVVGRWRWKIRAAVLWEALRKRKSGSESGDTSISWAIWEAISAQSNYAC